MQLNLVAKGQPEVVSAMNLHCINLVALLIESNHKINLNRGTGMNRIKKKLSGDEEMAVGKMHTMQP